MTPNEPPDTTDPPYSRTAASLYDELTGEHLRNVIRLIRSLVPQPGHCIDIGCGTGVLAESLCRCGWTVLGIDPSAAMIEVARTRRPHLDFRIGDATTFVVDSPASLITATSDVVNHLGSVRGVTQFLRRAAAALSEGGLLIFDSLTPFDINRNWAGYVDCVRRRRWCLTRIGHRKGPGRGTLTYDFFLQQSDGRYLRTVERHTLSAWPSATLTSLLREAGFGSVLRLDASTLSPATRTTVRWLFVATRRNRSNRRGASKTPV